MEPTTPEELVLSVAVQVSWKRSAGCTIQTAEIFEPLSVCLSACLPVRPPVRWSVGLCSRQQRPNVLKCEAVKRGRKRERAREGEGEGLPRRGDKAKKCALRRQGGRTDRAKIKSDHSTLFVPAARGQLFNVRMRICS